MIRAINLSKVAFKGTYTINLNEDYRSDEANRKRDMVLAPYLLAAYNYDEIKRRREDLILRQIRDGNPWVKCDIVLKLPDYLDDQFKRDMNNIIS